MGSPAPMVCLDPGHHSGSPGARGVTTRAEEHVVVLDFARLLEQALLERGFRVVLTRGRADAPISNAERAHVANSAGAALMVRIHCNAIGPARAAQVSGAMTLVPAAPHPLAGISAELAAPVHRAMLAAGGLPDLGIRPRGDLVGFQEAQVPAILLELGFLTHPGDEELLLDRTWQARVASGVADGITEALA